MLVPSDVALDVAWVVAAAVVFVVYLKIVRLMIVNRLMSGESLLGLVFSKVVCTNMLRFNW